MLKRWLPLAVGRWGLEVSFKNASEKGINFPLSNVVLCSHQYPYGKPMPVEDFWNISGCVGRAGHGQPGVFPLAALDAGREEKLGQYLDCADLEPNSTLIAMVEDALAGTVVDCEY